MKNLSALFLQTAYFDCAQDFARSLAKPTFPHWDAIILTASNERQANGFRKQLQLRTLPPATHFAVVPDREGQRVGSGGATLSVIRYCKTFFGDFKGRRILVIHSGGDSRRMPTYSALGKLFSPVPHVLDNGKSSSLFDELLIAMSSVPGRIREGMVLLSGDVLLLFNPLQIDYSGRGAAAISFKEDVQTGKDHGVFLKGESGNVRAFLHKQTAETLAQAGAVNERGMVDIDTGAVIFPPEMVSDLARLVETEAGYDRYVNSTVRLSLYGDFLYPLAEDSTLEQFQKEKPEGSFCPELTAARTDIWNCLRPYRMKLLQLAPAKFVHFGTTQEVLALMTDGVRAYSDLSWSAKVNSCIQGDCAGCDSVLSEKAAIGEGCYLEVSYVHSAAHVGSHVILSYIDIHDETIPDNVVLHGLKQSNGKFICRIYGIQDNPKEGRLFGRSLEEIFSSNPLELWEKDEPRTLWNARLYPECDTIREAVAAALDLHAMVMAASHSATSPSATLPAFWRQATRKSLCSGFNDADADALIAWHDRMAELVRMERVSELIAAGKPARLGKALLQTETLTDIQRQWLDRKLGQADFSERLRLHYYLGAALSNEAQLEACFRTISQGIQEETLSHLHTNEQAHIVRERHSVQLPLRVNWGGGWSDTPPFCCEHGGTVLNAAITLNGQCPVEVTMIRRPDMKVVFDSRDMDVHGEFDTIAPLQKTGDPYDPFALQKACLLACGIIPQRGSSLSEILSRLGGGFEMHSEVTHVPKGSGLGTSSILSAACTKATLEFCGIPYTEDDLYSYVLAMEQIMSTGGGWQDQVGGVTPGIKYISSRPGIWQKLKVDHVILRPETLAELNERFCLIYTGQRRLARHLLRDVVGRYVGNEPDSLFALNEIQKLAALMRFELERGDVDAFAKLLNQHWELSKKIDAGSTNTLIEHIFLGIEDLIDGRLICGAGGGGFLQVILKKGVSKTTVHQRLKEIFGDFAIDVWDCALL